MTDVTFPLTGYTFTLEMWQENDQRGHLVPMTVNGQSMIRLHALFEVGKLEMKAMIALAGATVFQGTTATELTIDTGEKTFNAGTGKAFGPGAPIQVVDASDPSRFVRGTSTAYDATTGVTTITVLSEDDTGGTGSITAANVSLAGTPGPTNTDAVAKSGDTMTGNLDVGDVASGEDGVVLSTYGGVEMVRASGGAYWDFRTAAEDYEVRLQHHSSGSGLETVDGTGDEFITGLKAGETSHATSNHSAVHIGNGWSLVQDTNGDGTRNLGLFNNIGAFFSWLLDATTGAITFLRGLLFIEGDLGTVTTNATITYDMAEFLKVTLGGNAAISATAVAGYGFGKSILFVQDGVGGRVPTFTGMVWTTDQPPWASMTTGQKAEISLIVRPDGRKKLSWVPEGE